jgi:serine/threonine-protein kinase
MGHVYAGKQHCPAREVAIKVIKDGVFADEPLRARFLRERDIAGAFEHPNIIRVYDAGQDADGQLYYVMELAARGTLRDFLQTTPLSRADAVRMMVEVALAVHHAHERGVSHRDLKPDNILIGGDLRPRVTDFGVARTLAEISGEPSADEPDASNTFVGSYPYMAPEQAGYPSASNKGATAPGRAADIYSLGAIMYELISGEPPCTARTRDELFRAFATGAPKALHHWAYGADYDLEAVVLRALAHDPSKRYAAASDFAADLRRTLGGRVPNATPTLWHKKLISAVSHHARWLGILLAALAVCAATVLTLAQRAQEQAIQRASASANTLGLIFAHAASLTRRFAEDPESAATLARSSQTTKGRQNEAWLARIGHDPIISSLFLQAPSGRVVAHFPPERDDYYQLDFKDRLYFRGTWLTGAAGLELGAYLSPVFKSQAREGQLKLAFSDAVRGDHGSQLGVAVVTVRLETLLEAAEPGASLFVPHEVVGAIGTARTEELVRVARGQPAQPLLMRVARAPRGSLPIARTRYQIAPARKGLSSVAADGLLLGVLALVCLCALALGRSAGLAETHSART